MPDPSAFSAIEQWVAAVMRVPPEPETPEGSPGSVQVFRAGRNYLVWCLIMWLVSHLFFLAVLFAFHQFGAKLATKMAPWGRTSWLVAESLAILAFSWSFIFTYFSQRLNYTLRWYIITDRSLRIRTGILNMRELTMTFSNIQEIRVSAGPLQNLLSLADVEVHSAGGVSEANHGGGHVGRFEGVSNANAIRDLIVERLRQYRDSGLGETSAQAPPPKDDAIVAAREVLAEVRALRKCVALL